MSLRQVLREVVRVEIKQLVRQLVREERSQTKGTRVTRPHIPVSRPALPTAYAPAETRSTYKGDSQAKKSARLHVWETVQKVLGDQFARGTHVFLASREGGDASTLRGLGVPDSSMLAVDIDPTAIQEFERKYPDIPNRNIDVGYALLDLKRSPMSIFLDFSSQVSDQTFNKVRFAIRHLSPGGILACTFAIGREKHWNGNGVAPCEERIRMVEEFVRKELSYSPRVLSRLRYTSESPSGPGSSLMFVVAFQMVEGKEPAEAALQEIGVQDLYRDVYRLRDNPELHWLINYTEHKAEALRKRVKAYPPPLVT